ncbi:MAG: Bax inhibitor-1/YccA family protein [Planctomycetaceae bacterium]
MRSGNPTLKETTFQDLGAFSETGMNWVDGASARSTVMTIQGTAQKTFILLLIAVATASFTWLLVLQGGAVNFAAAAPWVLGGAVVGLICSLVICFRPTAAPVMAPVYAAAEGLFLGGLSATF